MTDPGTLQAGGGGDWRRGAVIASLNDSPRRKPPNTRPGLHSAQRGLTRSIRRPGRRSEGRRCCPSPRRLPRLVLLLLPLNLCVRPRLPPRSKEEDREAEARDWSAGRRIGEGESELEAGERAKPLWLAGESRGVEPHEGGRVRVLAQVAPPGSAISPRTTVGSRAEGSPAEMAFPSDLCLLVCPFCRRFSARIWCFCLPSRACRSPPPSAKRARNIVVVRAPPCRLRARRGRNGRPKQVRQVVHSA